MRQGITLVCSVGVKLNESSLIGRRKYSAGFFAGIKISSRNLTLSETGETNLTFEPIVPFACENTNHNCELHVQGEDPDLGACKGNTFVTESKGCTVPIIGRNETHQGDFYTDGKYIQEYSMTLKHAQSADSFKRSATRTVSLSTNEVKHLFWSNTHIANVPVIVGYAGSVWRGRSCHSRGDPNYKTFDGYYFSHHEEGTYLMYRNIQSNLTVQLKTQGCFDSPSGYGQCGCGVAVRAGRDVFTLYTCYGSTIVDFPLCDDRMLKVRTDGDRKWKILLPSGTQVVIKLICWPECSNLNVDVYIYPSASDERKTEGICGILNGNRTDDLTLSNGTITWSTSSFARSWRLDTDLLPPYANEDKFKDLLPWPKEVLVCFCQRDMNNRRGIMPALRQARSELNCSYQDYREQCVTDKTKSFECVVTTEGAKRRRRRDIQRHHYRKRKEFMTGIDIFEDPQVQRIKRSTSEETAREMCSSTFNKSLSYEVCMSDVLSDADSYMDSCVSDVQLVGVQYAATAALESLNGACAAIVTKNVTLRTEKPDVVQLVYESTCPSNCSSHGKCENGTCICSSEFTGTDCSLEKNSPPEVHGITGSGFCDKTEGSCDRISLYGRNFLFTGLTACKISSTQILVNGNHTGERSGVYMGEQRSPFEAMCFLNECQDISKTAQSDVFVRSYIISVSNDGRNFSQDMELYVMDSTCQETRNSSGEISFHLKSGYCYIAEKCVPDLMENPGNYCEKCLTSDDMYKWTAIAGCSLPAQSSPDSSDSRSSSYGPVIDRTIMVVMAVSTIMQLLRLKWLK